MSEKATTKNAHTVLEPKDGVYKSFIYNKYRTWGHKTMRKVMREVIMESRNCTVKESNSERVLSYTEAQEVYRRMN
jgi:hypothetical protein